MDFSIGEKDPEDCGDVAEAAFELVELLLSAICDDFFLTMKAVHSTFLGDRRILCR